MSEYFGRLGQQPIGNLLLAMGALIVLCLAIWIAPRIRQGMRDRPLPVPVPAPVAKPFLTNRKHAMLSALERVLPMYRIHAQVSMGALLAPGGRLGPWQRGTDGGAFLWRIVDFVVVDPTSSSIVALIEMDERFAEPDENRQREALTTQAGYQTIRIPASDRATMATAQAAVGHLRDAALKAAPAVTRLPMPVRTWPLEGRFNGTR
ncbi:hypothetical protein J2X47_003720 [Sphingomonas sp. BE270]|jgi:hypothetical protein|uniref:DUF2726 domain-containing protein n=2 Tax=root TaxID=1 RepID=A0ABU4PG75_9SPHN|nr:MULTISPECIES: DUF2726 domain-containing protein [Sphingomonas]MDR7259516.1 hypothetical protein [Sphingomonas sp. BE270]MDX5983026.1 DUF2726 domain-containing protein [Sphingomonas echinoides]